MARALILKWDRILDQQMLCLLNAQERSLKAWKDLFTAADERLKLVGVIRPAASIISLLEFTLG
jgi:hypothetical protein